MINDTPLSRSFWECGRSDDCPVIDMHGHMGRWRSIWFPRAEPEAMLRTMDRSGVRMLCFAHHAALFCPDIGNQPAIEAVRKHPNRFRAYVGLNPHYPEHIERDLQSYDRNSDVFVGLKFLSSYHQVPWDAPVYERAWKFADERGLLVLGHTWGGSAVDGVDMVRKAAGRYRNISLLLGHSLHGRWEDAVATAREFPNVYLELCAVFDDRGVIEMFVQAGLKDRMLFGTDLPWFDPHHGIGALLSADITDEDRHCILHRNAEGLLAAVGVELEFG